MARRDAPYQRAMVEVHLRQRAGCLLDDSGEFSLVLSPSGRIFEPVLVQPLARRSDALNIAYTHLRIRE
jgi:hypothetical protein